MATLGELAILMRSKNAGPFWITFDILLPDEPTFSRVVKSEVLKPALFASIYDVPEEDIIFTNLPAANAIKVSFPRPRVQGDPGESDMYAGQQYAPLLDIEIP